MQIACPFCKKQMTMLAGMTGQQLKCPGCAGIFQAPASQPGPAQLPPPNAGAQQPNPFATNYQPGGHPQNQYPSFPVNQTPGKATAASILLTVGGGLATMTALGVLLGTFCIWFFAFYSVVAGIMALVFGIQSFNAPRGMAGSMKAAAIMLIITIISFDIISMTIGIIALVMLSDPEAHRHFA